MARGQGKAFYPEQFMSGVAREDRHDYVALEWVKGEIAETLEQVRQALEAFVDSPQDSTRMRLCLGYVHQVHGTLQMVEFHGAALLAEEMEQLTRALVDGRTANQAAALKVLMQAALQLPAYLDRIRNARRDLPMLVLPLLNDLRAARGEKLLSETSVFAPDLGNRQPLLSAESLGRLSTDELPKLLRRLRQMLQVALVGVVRNQELPTNLGHMARVFARLEILCQGAPLGPLWQIASGLVGGMASGAIANGTSVRALLRQVDKELKRLVEEGAGGMNQGAPDELIKNLLFYVARVPGQSSRIQSLKERYRLEEALSDTQGQAQFAGPVRGAMRSVVAALCEELVRVKDSLDLFVRSDPKSVGDLQGLVSSLKQIADTLAVLGFALPRKVVLEQIAVIQGLIRGLRQADDAVLMDVAGALLYVEATLAGMVGGATEEAPGNQVPSTDVARIHRLVIKEARHGLEQAKDAIIEFIASQWDHAHLARVPALLTQSRGGLGMIPLPRVAALLDACNCYIQDQLLSPRAIPDWQSLDSFADAITSVECYLERLTEDYADQGERILDVAEKSLEHLGYPLDDKGLFRGERPVPTGLSHAGAIAAGPNAADIMATPVQAINPPAGDVPVSLLPPAAAEEPVDGELVDIFLDEAVDLLDSAGLALERWLDEPDNQQALSSLLRDLHTLKGGARMAGQRLLGDMAHDLEQHLSPFQQADAWSESLLVDVQSGYDGLLKEAAKLRARLGADAVTEDPVDDEVAVSGTAITPCISADRPPERSGSSPHVLPFVRRAQEAARDAAARRTPQELVRVPAELLEGLVNLAGETAIFRARVEQQVSDVGFTLDELEATIDRVRDQLRRLDIETQAQVLSRYRAEAERAGYGEFDPLEMDRHSQLQQLSRALFESASDLLDLKETLAARNRDAETLLLQQARVNTELQEGLMRTRMVPFERMVPRLRRIVRQVAGELGKQVEFVVGNAEGEMDRAVLERIVAPLEHMLRNAVDHGIEDAAQRRAAGKPEQGRIRLELGREGGYILLTLSDDGGGINLEAVRRQAVGRGLMTENSDLPDQDVLQFILEAGFSTAEQVTQISGRGVGMDVVSAEVKQLGGSMVIESTLGQGTRFLVRLPFTVSVNRALMVYAGEDLYAVPLNTIEGIVRVSPHELEGYYRAGAPRFEHAGQGYQLRYLGDLLNNGQQPRLVGQSLPLPVILVRSNEHAVAVQVDSLAGSREIVVKSLGCQFAGVPGITGATILGDGRVVVILDLLATIRIVHAQLLSAQQPPPPTTQHGMAAELEANRPTLVMVVDDSVTVRKVTSRLLERNGMNVLTAKDGMEAITQLQDHLPDIILLDIEMPRMDGFEVANLVRHDDQMKELPIIMITSRTGEKHRERAFAIGVNEYLGKPYQEVALLETINRLVERNA